MESLSPADAAFAERWIIDELPACPVGLSLLRQLAESKAHLFAIVERSGFTDPADPELTAHSLWRKFVVHYNTCLDFNEV